jgi:hypothetical protein
MRVDDFTRRWELMHRMTVDFVEIVPDEKWDFSPDPPGRAARAQDPLRHGDGFAPFSKQVSTWSASVASTTSP